ncbi:DUF7673 family protein [Zobellella taiwanensis]
MSDKKKYFHVIANNEPREAFDKGACAIRRIMSAAGSGHEHADYLRLFILALYDSGFWPCDLDNLRLLEPEYQLAVLQVLALDFAYPGSIRLYLEDHEELLHRWWNEENRRRRRYGTMTWNIPRL